jgi:ABC-2 type transport system permease protein
VVAQLVRLKLTLLANTFRRSVWQTIGLVVASLYGVGILCFVVTAAVAGGAVAPELTGQVLTVVGALVVLAWWVVPLFAFGVDATLDPLRFVTFAIPRRRLLAGLGLAGVISVPGVVTALGAVGVSFGWWRDPAALAAALAGAVCAVALCVLGSRALTTLLAPLLDTRRSREVLAVAAIVPLLLIGPAVGWVAGGVERTVEDASVTVTVGGAPAEVVGAVVGPLAAVLAWTPFGAPWAFGSAVHDGAWALLAARVAITLACLAVLWRVWDGALARVLVTPRGGGSAGVAEGLGWFGRLPATPTGAVAARCATYWLRDPRYAASVAAVPLLPVLMLVVGATSGAGDRLLLLVAPVVAWLLGFGISNDVGYDNTAFALHVATGITGRADRWGRVIPVAAVGVPVTVGFAVVACAVTGGWALLPALLGTTLGTLGTSLGISSAVSARLVYPVPKPGESPVATPKGAAMATMVSQMIAMALMLVLLLPTAVLAVLGVVLPSPALGWAALAVGVASGAGVLLGGVRWGARVFDRRRPELLQQVMAFG